MWILLPLLLLSCRIDTIPEVTPIPEVSTEAVTQAQETTLQGTYKRSIGSQFEVYEISEQLIVYIQTGDTMDKIFQADYSYTETDIIIDNNLYPYELSFDKIVICGYTYYRF